MPAIVDGSGSNAANTAVLYASAGVLPAVSGASLTNLPSQTGRLIRAPQVLTSGTSYTTPADCTDIVVQAVGGGGGGSRSSSSVLAAGGGGGGYVLKYFAVTANTSYTYAIGAGGAGATTNNASGTGGGNTTFTVGATTITAGGGGGGVHSGSGASGSATNGDLNIPGQTAGTYSGGCTPLGWGALSSSIPNGQIYGGGASANTANTGNGGTGANGVVIVWEYT